VCKKKVVEVQGLWRPQEQRHSMILTETPLELLGSLANE